MSIYHNFIGIDIGKFSFAVASHGKNNVIYGRVLPVSKEFKLMAVNENTFIYPTSKAIMVSAFCICILR